MAVVVLLLPAFLSVRIKFAVVLINAPAITSSQKCFFACTLLYATNDAKIKLGMPYFDPYRF